MNAIVLSVLAALIAAYAMYSLWARRNRSFRIHCGECSYTTPWLTRSDAEDCHRRHYAEWHPGVRPHAYVRIGRR